ncbi:MAG: hypothetical protein N4A35_16985 [Flavobacteriales bacterium]|jgi:hypothetical protein|nr:hypothetical protein [Flavobacteriales bacterium]
MNKTQTVLPVSEMKIIKRINIVSQNWHPENLPIGFIIYERNFTEEYKILPEEKDSNNLSNLISGYPKQENYPHDEIDELILNTVKTEYPKSFVQNKLVFTSSDIEYFDNLIKRPFEKALFRIKPDFSNLDLSLLSGQEFECINQEINVYVDHSSELIKNIFLDGNCDFDHHKALFRALKTIKFL